MNQVNKNEIVGAKVRSLAAQLLASDETCLALTKHFTKEEVAGAAANICMALVGRGLNRDLVTLQTPIALCALGLTWRVDAGIAGNWAFVSCEDGSHKGDCFEDCPLITNPYSIIRPEVERVLTLMDGAYGNLLTLTTQAA